MNKEKLLQYLDFLKTECNRYSKDERVDDNEITLLKIEIDRFVQLLNESKIDQKVKDIVFKIDFDIQPTSKDIFFDILISVVSSGWMTEQQNEQNLANTLKKIALEVENAIFEIKALV